MFTDASKYGWAYVITQCHEDELSKPWAEQRHEILTVNSGRWGHSQKNWDMSGMEAFPIRKAAEKERTLL